jgi:hypothetical protein
MGFPKGSFTRLQQSYELPSMERNRQFQLTPGRTRKAAYSSPCFLCFRSSSDSPLGRCTENYCGFAAFICDSGPSVALRPTGALRASKSAILPICGSETNNGSEINKGSKTNKASERKRWGFLRGAGSPWVAVSKTSVALLHLALDS